MGSVTGTRPGRWVRALVVAGMIAGGVGGSSTAAARGTSSAGATAGVDRFEVKSVTDAFGSQSFGPAGPYESIAAVVRGKLDPNDPANAPIVDLDKAPRTDSLVDYQTDVGILRPRDPSMARRVLFYDDEASGGVTRPEDAVNALFMRQGYTVVPRSLQWQFARQGAPDRRLDQCACLRLELDG